jgi:glycine cleavage system H protein
VGDCQAFPTLEAMVEDPTLVNVDPYGKGWLVEVDLDDPEELDRLMNFDDYETFVEE